MTMGFAMGGTGLTMGMGVKVSEGVGMTVETGGVEISMDVAPGWNPDALCDGSTASERAQWLVSNEGISQIAAQQKVMMEFPALFGGIDVATCWNPVVLCDGSLAGDSCYLAHAE